MIRRSWLLVALTMVVVACAQDAAEPNALADPSSADEASPETTVDDSAAPDDVDDEPEPTTTTAPRQIEVTGVVQSSVDGSPLGAATVSAGDESVTTGPDGRFVLSVTVGDTLTVDRPVWSRVVQEVRADDDTSSVEVEVVLEPTVVRGLRVARDVAADPERFDDLLTLIEGTTVNTLVFDTKDETNFVLYDTDVEFAYEIEAVDAVYDPTELLALARERDLYAVTRIVTFEDGAWARGQPQAKLAGTWVDASNALNWEYPLALAEEACALGFDEIQFDYVRFPAGRTAEVASALLPSTSEARAQVIAQFLDEARSRLHPEGCGVSAAIFGIVMSSETDEGIGQTPEAVSASVDAVSPMLYPSHYGPGWLGFADPNDHPGPVIAHALDQGEPKLEPNVLVRPWIQGFEYNSEQVLAQINESEARGAGWIIWNYLGNYRRDWLPLA